MSGRVPECFREACELVASTAVATTDLDADANVAVLLSTLVTDRSDVDHVRCACVALSSVDAGRRDKAFHGIPIPTMCQ